MGVERSVTCWYVKRQTILNEIALLESQLKLVSVPVLLANVQAGDIADARTVELLLQLARAKEKLNSLGPCPKPMMG
jgi:hypothetical protein